MAPKSFIVCRGRYPKPFIHLHMILNILEESQHQKPVITERHIETQKHRQKHRPTNKQTDRQKDRQTYRQTERIL